MIYMLIDVTYDAVRDGEIGEACTSFELGEKQAFELIDNGLDCSAGVLLQSALICAEQLKGGYASTIKAIQFHIND